MQKNVSMLYKRKELNYELNDLEPFIDYKTMNEHYNVHYKKYTDNLNQALLEGEILTDGSLGSLVDILIAYQNNNKIRNNNKTQAQTGILLNHLINLNNNRKIINNLIKINQLKIIKSQMK